MTVLITAVRTSFGLVILNVDAGKAFAFGIVNTISAVRQGGVGCGLGDVMYGNRKLGLAVTPRVFGIVGFDAQAVWIGQLCLNGAYTHRFGLVMLTFLCGHAE